MTLSQIPIAQAQTSGPEKNSTVAVSWAHPDANLQLYLSPPGREIDKAKTPLPRW